MLLHGLDTLGNAGTTCHLTVDSTHFVCTSFLDAIHFPPLLLQTIVAGCPSCTCPLPQSLPALLYNFQTVGAKRLKKSRILKEIVSGHLKILSM